MRIERIERETEKAKLITIRWRDNEYTVWSPKSMISGNEVNTPFIEQKMKDMERDLLKKMTYETWEELFNSEWKELMECCRRDMLKGFWQRLEGKLKKEQWNEKLEEQTKVFKPNKYPAKPKTDFEDILDSL